MPFGNSSGFGGGRKGGYIQPPHVFNSIAGLQNWITAKKSLDNFSTQIHTLLFLGNSITCGVGSGDTIYTYDNLSWAGRIRNRLNARYDDFRKGFNTSYYAIQTLLNITYAGTWSRYYDSGMLEYRGTTTNGSTATFTFNSEGIRIYYIRLSSGGTVTTSIDEGAEVSHDLSGTLNLGAYFDVTGLSDGQHTITVKYTGDSSHRFYFTGYMELNSTATRGVRCIKIGRSGQEAGTAFTNSNITSACIDTFQPKLTILEYGANDYMQAHSVSTYTTAMQNAITKIKQYGDCILLIPKINYVSSAVYQDYVDAQYELANTNNCVIIDYNKKWTTTDGYTGDGVHPTGTRGYPDIARDLADLLQI